MTHQPLDFHELLEVLPQIEQSIQYGFHQKKWLLEAFIHRSYLNEAKETLTLECNERLEFLGDSLLHILVSRFLFEQFPHLQEGDLSRLRSQIVDAQTCSRLLEKLNVGAFVLVGKGQRLSGRSSSLEADLFEAILGALFLDGGWLAVERFFQEHCKKEILEICEKPQRNYKAELQDLLQKKAQITPHYGILNELGPDHTKAFEVGVFAKETLLGKGLGSSKKQAQQDAAKSALEKLGATPGIWELLTSHASHMDCT
jgi:ribonuclease-3